MTFSFWAVWDKEKKPLRLSTKLILRSFSILRNFSGTKGVSFEDISKAVSINLIASGVANSLKSFDNGQSLSKQTSIVDLKLENTLDKVEWSLFKMAATILLLSFLRGFNKSMKVEDFWASTLTALKQVPILGISVINSLLTYFLNDSEEELF